MVRRGRARGGRGRGAHEAAGGQAPDDPVHQRQAAADRHRDARVHVVDQEPGDAAGWPRSPASRSSCRWRRPGPAGGRAPRSAARSSTSPSCRRPPRAPARPGTSASQNHGLDRDAEVGHPYATIDRASPGISHVRWVSTRRNSSGPISAPNPRAAKSSPVPIEPMPNTTRGEHREDGEHPVAQPDRGLHGHQRQHPGLAPDVAQRLDDRGQRPGRHRAGARSACSGRRTRHTSTAARARQTTVDGEADVRAERLVHQPAQGGADDQHRAPGAAAERVGRRQVLGIDHIGQCRAGGRACRTTWPPRPARSRPGRARPCRASATANSSAIAAIVPTLATIMSLRRSNRSARVPANGSISAPTAVSAASASAPGSPLPVSSLQQRDQRDQRRTSRRRTPPAGPGTGTGSPDCG